LVFNAGNKRKLHKSKGENQAYFPISILNSHASVPEDQQAIGLIHVDSSRIQYAQAVFEKS